MRLSGCTHDHDEADILRAAASIAGKRQTPHKSGGRPGKPTHCPKCGRKHPSARAARTCQCVPPLCPECGCQMAHYAGPGRGERGFVCLQPGCFEE